MLKSTLDSAERSSRRARAHERLLEMHFESGVGHVGGNLSALDLLLALYHDVLGPEDQFVLSKGHAAGALYVALWTVGLVNERDLREFHGDGTLFSGHPPPRGIETILFATGSLGHGIGLAAGLALGKRLRGEGGRVYCLTSDGEWNEGSCWESLIFARHQRLENLSVLVDLNGWQGFGPTCEVADLGSLADKFRAFAVDTLEIDGHDTAAIARALGPAPNRGLQCVVARTRKGRGVSFMEDRLEWHYLPMTREQFAQATREVRAA